MKRNMMRRNLQQSILRSLGRYLALIAIIALGCALFVGLKVTKTDMVLTGQDYTDEQNMFDLRLLNTYGWTDKQLEQIRELPGVADAEGSVYLDAFVAGSSGQENVFRLIAVPERINQVYLLEGRMPTSAAECLVDGEYFGSDAIGTVITISANNEQDTLDSLTEQTYTVVGRISTPLYMDMTRGSTSLGSGSLATYIYLHPQAFCVDYYTEIYVTMYGDWTVYSDEHNDAMDALAEQLKVDITPLAQQRFEDILADAEGEFADGMAEYLDGLSQYEEGKAEADQQLADALKELEDAQAQIDAAWVTITDGETQILEAQLQLDEGKATLDASKLTLENTKSETFSQIAAAYTELLENYKLVTESLAQVEDGITQIDDGIIQIDDGLSQIESSLPLLELVINLTELQVNTAQTALKAAQIAGDEVLIQALTEQLSQAQTKLSEYQSQYDTAVQTQAELETTRASLVTQREELVQTKATLEAALLTIDTGFVELETNQKVAENQFASAVAQIEAGYLELQAGQAELDAKKLELEQGKQDLLEAQAQLDEGRAEYEKGKLEAEAELADAWAQLEDAQQQLADARQTIDDMASPDVFAMTRNTNAGYLALDSNSDIVDGIAVVLPVFFLLIASLVCITTMTRMVEEERTQIGTLKALGYGSAAIMSKYIGYSASAAIIGCILGVIVGSTFFPNLLWNAYSIIFNIRPNLVLTVDWGLSIGITAAYIGVSTLVTWYCCHRTLREVPAGLIRPKSPQVGKKTLLEYLPFWNKLSFLNKVMLRNVFRYKQRFLMMLIGIGGCTALLLTGFGLRDTIVDIANIQFEEVNHFDIEVYFSEGQSEEDQRAFLDELSEKGISNNVSFFYQTSVEMEFDSKVRDVYMISAENDISTFLSFRLDDEALPMPGPGQTLISVGVSEILGIDVGDTITVRNSDLQELTLTVSGIYENYVYNYCVVTPETLLQQWGEVPQDQMAFLMVNKAMDTGEANAAISSMEDVINTTVCEESANVVNNMMKALDLLVVVIVFCAGLLAAIVLYNLTNININERIREIATIKVLGFRAGETSAYVFKENILLTFFGTGFGLILGKWFLDFVMLNIKIDMVWFKTRLNFPSYIYAVVLTLLCAAVVDFIFHHKLEKINMAEALKSVE